MSNAGKVFAVAVLAALAWVVGPVAEAQPPIQIGATLGHSPRPASQRSGWALALAEPRGTARRPLSPRPWQARHARGRARAGAGHLATATTMSHEMDVRVWLTEAETALRDLT